MFNVELCDYQYFLMVHYKCIILQLLFHNTTWIIFTSSDSVPVCPPLTAPDNGDVDCELGETCTFTCDDGYELGGNTNRSCGDDESWSGTDISCTKGMHYNVTLCSQKVANQLLYLPINNAYNY